MLTLGTWLGPVIGAVVATTGISWAFRIRFRRGTAIDRMAWELAMMRNDPGYPPDQTDEWHDWFTGKRKDAPVPNSIRPRT